MARLTQLGEVLFDVEEHPVFASVKVDGVERRLPVHDKKAIVNTRSGHVLGVVGRAYRLVTNREALEMASQCCLAVFPETKAGEWKAATVDAPTTAGYCRIDLVHNSTALDFSFVAAADRPEAFGPFIRVTNSYNGQRALTFDIGFYRKVCRNGLILPDTIIRFRFVHSKRGIGEAIRFEIARDRLAELKSGFGELLGALRRCAVPEVAFGPLVRGVLSIRPPKKPESDARAAKHWRHLTDHLAEMEGRYLRELGENAYAVFNVITDFASHPPANSGIYRDRHKLQQLAGSWVSRFSQQCRESDFNLTNYLKELAKPDVELET